MVPYEAFLSEKPVVTTTDSGGPLEVVADGGPDWSPSRAPKRSPRAFASWLRDASRRRRPWGARGQAMLRRARLPGTRTSSGSSA